MNVNDELRLFLSILQKKSDKCDKSFLWLVVKHDDNWMDVNNVNEICLDDSVNSMNNSIGCHNISSNNFGFGSSF